MEILLFGINAFVAISRSYYAIKNQRIIIIVWFLVSYFSVLMLSLSFSEGFSRYRGFSNDVVRVEPGTILKLGLFVLVFNCLFMVGEWTSAKVLRIRKATLNREARESVIEARFLMYTFGIVLALSSSIYLLDVAGKDYRHYVEYKGSNWALAFFWASSAFVPIAALNKRYFLALMGCLPFVVAAYLLQVRSFALLSIIPFVVVYLYQVLVDKSGATRIGSLKTMISVVVSLLLLGGLSVFIKYSVSGNVGLPDAGLPYGAAIIFQEADKEALFTGWNSLALYASNCLRPFLILFGMSQPQLTDTPVIMARLIDGVPTSYDVYYHYPTTWYADSYLSFGHIGVWLGLFWGVVVSLYEKVMGLSRLWFALLLPFYVWHAYMLVRGSVAVAAVPFSYAMYITLLVSLVVGAWVRLAEAPRA